MTETLITQYFKKRLLSFKYASKGIKFLIKTQVNFQIHLLIAFLVLSSGFFLDINAIEWGILMLTISSVWVAEAFNTAIEELVNFVSPEWQKQAGLVKDISAGAVLLSSFMAFFIGLTIFLPKISEYINT